MSRGGLCALPSGVFELPRARLMSVCGGLKQTRGSVRGATGSCFSGAGLSVAAARRYFPDDFRYSGGSWSSFLNARVGCAYCPELFCRRAGLFGLWPLCGFESAGSIERKPRPMPPSPGACGFLRVAACFGCARDEVKRAVEWRRSAGDKTRFEDDSRASCRAWPYAHIGGSGRGPCLCLRARFRCV